MEWSLGSASIKQLGLTINSTPIAPSNVSDGLNRESSAVLPDWSINTGGIGGRDIHHDP